MKVYKSIITVVVCCFGGILASCSDWLDYTPKDKQTYEQQFSSSAGFYNAVNGVYNKISGSTLYGYNLSYGPLDIMGQCYRIPTANTSMIEFKKYTWTGKVATQTFNDIWAEAYSTILNINLILNAAETYRAVLKDKDYQLVKAEMLAARAFLHFDLLRLFGPVYSKKPRDLSIPFNDGVEAVRRERLPADQMLNDKLLPDLNIAQNILKEIDPVITKGPLNTDGGDDGNWERYRQLRMNYYAVSLLKARIYLWMGDYGNALSEAQKITDDVKVKEWFPFVNPNKLLANNTNPDRVFSTECLFGYYRNEMENIYLKSFSGSLDVLVGLQPRQGYVDGTLFPVASDYRRQSQWTGSISASGADCDFIKYKGFTPNKTTPEFWATFYGLMRISEAYYIAAEAYLNAGNLPKACEYLNVILAARGIEGLDADLVTNGQILDDIKLEYLREMRGEGQIFYLFKRFFQGFGSWSDGNPDLNASEEDPLFDTPSTNRYIIPIPSAETN